MEAPDDHCANHDVGFRTTCTPGWLNAPTGRPASAGSGFPRAADGGLELLSFLPPPGVLGVRPRLHRGAFRFNGGNVPVVLAFGFLQRRFRLRNRLVAA